MATPQEDLLEVLLAGGAGLSRELLASLAGTAGGIVDTLNPTTPLPTLEDYGNRINQTSDSLRALGWEAPEISEGNMLRLPGAAIAQKGRELVQQYPNEAEFAADVLSNPSMVGALGILDAGGMTAPFRAPLRQGAEALVEEGVDLATSPEAAQIAELLVRGPQSPDSALSGPEALAGALMDPAAQQQAITFPAEYAADRYRRAAETARADGDEAKAARYEEIANEVEENVALAQAMGDQGESREDIARRTGIQQTPVPRNATPKERGKTDHYRYDYEVPSEEAAFPLTSDRLTPSDGEGIKRAQEALRKNESEQGLYQTLLDDEEARSQFSGAIERLGGVMRDPDNPESVRLRGLAAEENLISEFPEIEKVIRASMKAAGVPRVTKKDVSKVFTDIMFKAKRKGWDPEGVVGQNELETMADVIGKDTDLARTRLENTINASGARGKVTDVLEWELLQDLVPELGSIGYRYDPKMDDVGGYYAGRQDRPGITLDDVEGIRIGRLKETPGVSTGGRVHELQHAVEDIFGMPRGGSPREFGYSPGMRVLDEDVGELTQIYREIAEIDRNADWNDPDLVTAANNDVLEIVADAIDDAEAAGNKRLQSSLTALREQIFSDTNMGLPIARSIAKHSSDALGTHPKYLSLRGEANANTAEARFGMTAEEIRNNPRVTEMEAQSPLPLEAQYVKGQSQSVGSNEKAIKRPTFRGGREREPKWDIYDDPVTIAREAEGNVADEHPLMRELGTSREELAAIALERFTDPDAFTPGGVKLGGKGAKAANRITTPSNTDRLIEQLAAFQKYAPRMTEGMAGWYIFDPLVENLARRHGPEEARRAFTETNSFTAPHSAGSPVDWEIQRGMAARDLFNAGRFDEWVHGGGKDPSTIGLASQGVKGHLATGSQTQALMRYLETGDWGFGAPKVHSYLQAADPYNPQSAWAVGDAHFGRAKGLGDVRTNQDFGASLTAPEMAVIGPWFREIAGEVGMPAVPAQATNWGGFAKRTGVKSAVGAPKLEFFLDEAQKLMQRDGISFEEAIDRVFGVGGRTYYDVR